MLDWLEVNQTWIQRIPLTEYKTLQNTITNATKVKKATENIRQITSSLITLWKNMEKQTLTAKLGHCTQNAFFRPPRFAAEDLTGRLLRQDIQGAPRQDHGTLLAGNVEVVDLPSALERFAARSASVCEAFAANDTKKRLFSNVCQGCFPLRKDLCLFGVRAQSSKLLAYFLLLLETETSAVYINEWPLFDYNWSCFWGDEPDKRRWGKR